MRAYESRQIPPAPSYATIYICTALWDLDYVASVLDDPAKLDDPRLFAYLLIKIITVMQCRL